MGELTTSTWISQIVISKDELVTNCDRLNTLKHSSVNPYVFTEQGVAMLAGILKIDDPEYSTVPILETVQREGSHQENHFEEVHEMVTIGSSVRRQVESNTLTSYACRAKIGAVDFMVSQNAIPSRKYLAFFKMNIETFDLRSQLVTSRE